MFTKFYSILQGSDDDVSYSETISSFWALSDVYLQSKRFESPLCFLVQVRERNLAGDLLKRAIL